MNFKCTDIRSNIYLFFLTGDELRVTNDVSRLSIFSWIIEWSVSHWWDAQLYDWSGSPMTMDSKNSWIQWWYALLWSKYRTVLAENMVYVYTPPRWNSIHEWGVYGIFVIIKLLIQTCLIRFASKECVRWHRRGDPNKYRKVLRLAFGQLTTSWACVFPMPLCIGWLFQEVSWILNLLLPCILASSLGLNFLFMVWYWWQLV